MSESLSNQREKQPILVLSCQRESHPFQERTIVLNEIVKVGRSVARVKPSPTNAIFDCKVLSRSHALIWYKNGRFWLRDTNSSNGTFVNNTRIVKKNEDEHSDREIFSGDIIRFGVDVVEHDTTHGCIIAQVTLFYPSGIEAKNVSAEPVTGSNGLVGIETMHAEQLFRLTHYINEALFREQVLDTKLESIKHLLQETQNLSEAGWQAMLNEERLLEKLDLYENQLSILKQDLSKDSLQSQLAHALEEKFNLEKASKMMLERVLNEKTEIFNKATVLEHCLADTERECAQLRLDYESTQEAFQNLVNDREAKSAMLDQLEKRLKEADSEKRELLDRIDQRAHEVEVIQGVLDRLTQRKASKTGGDDPIPTHTSDENCKETSGLVNGLENGLPPSSVSAEDAHIDWKRPQQNENKLREGIFDEVAMTDIFDADKICEEANLNQIPIKSSEQIPRQVVDCLKYLGHSLEALRTLQSELETFCNLHPGANTTSVSETDPLFTPTTESLDSKAEPLLNQIPYDQPNKEALQNVNIHYVLTVLPRVQGLAELVAGYHSKAEKSLAMLQNCDHLENIAGDIRIPPIESNHLPEDNPNEAISKHNTAPLDSPLASESHETQALVGSNPSSMVIDAYAQLVPKTNGDDLVGSDLDPSSDDRGAYSVDQDELTKLREELRISVEEAATYQQMAENIKQQDAAKAELLRSVREECNALRQRILLIEADVTTSREDHQRLVTEARRARAEAEELRQERDKLLSQLSNTNQIVKDSDPLTTDQNDLHRRNASSNFVSQDNLVRSTAPSLQSASNPGATNSLKSTSISQNTTVAECSLSLLVIIPIMVLLSAFMAYIFLKFTR